jgi:hypothetical protein
MMDWNEFMESRRRWLSVRRVPNGHGGHDIMIKIDGTYFDKVRASDMKEYFQEEIDNIESPQS